MEITLDINGSHRPLSVPAGISLLEVLRDYAGLTGAKYGCGEGQCGCCTVLIDGAAAKSCLLPATAATRKKIVTIEGLAEGGELHPVQQAFLDHSAFQCGFCTPAMILGAVGLLLKNPKPTAEQIRDGLQGHLCRCGTYPRIVDAVRAASQSGKAQHA